MVLQPPVLNRNVRKPLPSYLVKLVEDQREPDPDRGDPLREELVSVTLLDENGEAFGNAVISFGPLAFESIEPRDIFVPAILARAAKIMLVHTHPDGNPEPSPYDIDFTRRAARLGLELGIELDGHGIFVSKPGETPYVVAPEWDDL